MRCKKFIGQNMFTGEVAIVYVPSFALSKRSVFLVRKPRAVFVAVTYLRRVRRVAVWLAWDDMEGRDLAGRLSLIKQVLREWLYVEIVHDFGEGECYA